MEKEKAYNAVLGKLTAHNISIDDDWQKIKECLSRTVLPLFCLRIALEIREKLNMNFIKEDRK